MSEVWYSVTEKTLTDMADSVRGLVGKTGKMTPGEMAKDLKALNITLQEKTVIPTTEEQTVMADEGYYGLSSVTVKAAESGGGGSGGSDTIPDASMAEFGRVKDATATGKAYYNGVLLPEISADVLAQYPYCWIRLKGLTYDLILGPNTWFCQSDMFYTQDSTYVWYSAEKGSESWTYYATYTDNGSFGLENGIVWSNHDIPNGSATATDIYFKGSEPVKEVIYGYGDFISGADKYAVTIEALNEIAHKIQLQNASYELVSGEEILDFLKGAIL